MGDRPATRRPRGLLKTQRDRLTHATRLLTGNLRPSHLVPRKLFQMRDLTPGGTVILGNSIPHGAFSPDHMRQTVFNACVDRAQPDVFLRWWSTAVAPLAKPSRLVLAFCGFEFNEHSANRHAWWRALDAVPNLLAWQEQAASRRLLGALFSRSGRQFSATTAGNHLPAMHAGWCPSYMDRSDYTSDAMWDVARGFYTDYTLSEQLLTDLSILIRAARDRDCEVLIVRHPMRQALVDLFPGGKHDLDAVWKAIADTAQRWQVAMHTAPELDGGLHYADALHLNRTGMQMSSAWLDEVLTAVNGDH